MVNLDFAPTLLDFAGVPVPPEMQGRSLRPLAEGQKPEGWREGVYYHYYDIPRVAHVRPHYGIRTDRHKLIHFYGDLDVWELYDLEKDPHEMTNLYGDPEYSEAAAKLLDQLERSSVSSGTRSVDAAEAATLHVGQRRPDVDGIIFLNSALDLSLLGIYVVCR